MVCGQCHASIEAGYISEEIKEKLEVVKQNIQHKQL